jgi:DEAD/DEAH box helicase domain-containing protein
LRNIAEGNFTVLDRAHGHTLVGEVDYHAAASTLYPQAIYIVAGQTYQVMALDWPGRRATVDPVDVDYYTDSMTHSGVRVLDVFGKQPLATAVVVHGEIHVFERVVGFKKIRFATGENVGYGEVDLPENELHTTAIWIQPTPELLQAVSQPRHRVVYAMDGLAQALKRVASVQLMCDPSDLGTTLVSQVEGELPTLYLYERYPGGVGFHEHLFEALDEWLVAVERSLTACACDDGCPACVGAPAPIAQDSDQPRSRALARAVVAAIRSGAVIAQAS